MKTSKSTKRGQAAGHGNIAAELVNTDLRKKSKELTKLFNKVKEENIASRGWNGGLIVKPKEGDLSVQNGGALHIYLP